MKNMFDRERERTVCFTGHRSLGPDFDARQLAETVGRLMDEGYDTFLDGMAIGFDLAAFETVLEERKKRPDLDVKIVACVPCLTQDVKFGTEDKARYRRLLEVADIRHVLHENYVYGCMDERNRLMVDNAALCVSYLNKCSGGTYYTTRYAISKDVRVIYTGRDGGFSSPD